MKFRLLTVSVAAIAFLACASLASASQITVDFDNIPANIPATCCVANTSQSDFSSWMTFGMMRIDGGMVVANPDATTAPNVYEAFSVAPPNKNSMFGSIEMVFSSPVSNMEFDVINNSGATSSFTAYAFDSHGNPLGVDPIELSCTTCSGAVGHVSFDFGNIGEVFVKSSAGSTFMAFAIDTVKFSAGPEPGSLVLLGSGILALWSQRRRFFSN